MAFPSWDKLGISPRDIEAAVRRNEPIKVELTRELFDSLRENEGLLKEMIRKECGDDVSRRVWLDVEDGVCMLRTFRVNIPVKTQR